VKDESFRVMFLTIFNNEAADVKWYKNPSFTDGSISI
jgi:hypothetical protein